ncbi:MarR family winged helix-turn-helix transcriptional regulator [Aestuariibius sp. 2305UL40-4]|uniref:MarR family winged helix-turn-helix transcriptional regulator n=1 Tax=Aestuariibius violaceus TaxID=3234132 RepID=UPI00345ED9DC
MIADPSSPLGFARGHLPVLMALRDGHADTQRDLARFARIERPPMAQILNRMERDGLIERKPDPRDGRSQKISPTPMAVERMPLTIDALMAGNREALSGLSDEEAAQFEGLVLRIIETLDRMIQAS